MSENRAILFSAPMVRALLDGTKTQTRRIVKGVDEKNWIALKGGYGNHIADEKSLAACPHGVVGDRLWVREAWRTAKAFDRSTPTKIAKQCVEAGWTRPWAPVAYEADGLRDNWEPSFGDPGRYRHARFMPRWASRITLEMTSVRVQRLHDISEEDARAEGVIKVRDSCYAIRGFDYDLAGLCHTSPVTPFQKLWDSINGKGAWDANPWVWAISFKRA